MKRFGAALVLGLCVSQSCHAVVLGQLDTFPTGNSPAWISGANANPQPSVAASGGPAGAPDSYLSVVTSGSHNTQSKLVFFTNGARWLGNYTAQGITALEMDVKSFGDVFGSPITLELRLAIKISADPTSAGYASSVGVMVPSDGLWHRIKLSLAPADLVPIGNPALSLTQTLSAPSEIRILHSNTPALKGSQINGAIEAGFDNIRAVPEPSTAAYLSIGTLLAWRRLRRR